MNISKLDYKEKPSKWIALTAIFTGLFVLGKFIAIPEIGSIESIVTWVSAGLFGPWLAVISGTIGVVLSFFIKLPDLPIFIPSTIIGVIMTSLIMGYGRKLAFMVWKSSGMNDRRRRMVTESIIYILMQIAQYSFYLLYNLAFGIPGYEIRIVITFVVKLVLLPIGLILIEAIRKSLNKPYFDLELAETGSIKEES